MRKISYEEVCNLAKNNPNKYLRLYWGGAEAPIRKAPTEIVSEVEAGRYAAEEFDKESRCWFEEDFLEEQAMIERGLWP